MCLCLYSIYDSTLFKSDIAFFVCCSLCCLNFLKCLAVLKSFRFAYVEHGISTIHTVAILSFPFLLLPFYRWFHNAHTLARRLFYCSLAFALFTLHTHLTLLRYRSSLPGLVRPSFVVHGLIEGRKLEMANITWIWCWCWRCRCRCCMCNDLFQIKMVMVIYGINTLVPEICLPPCAVQKC